MQGAIRVAGGLATTMERVYVPEEVFSAVAKEVGQLADADIMAVLRYETGGIATAVGGWSGSGIPAMIGARRLRHWSRTVLRRRRFSPWSPRRSAGPARRRFHDGGSLRAGLRGEGGGRLEQNGQS